MINMRKRKSVTPLSLMDKEFFDKFYEIHKRFMFYTARKYVFTQPECEDLVQDAVIRLMNNVTILKGLTENKARTYIALTIKSAFLDIEKAKHGDNPVPLTDETLEALADLGQFEQLDEADSSANMDVAILKKELSPRDWFVLEGKYILGYSQDEIGNIIGTSPDSVRMIICRVREKARRILHADTPMEANKNGR